MNTLRTRAAALVAAALVTTTATATAAAGAPRPAHAVTGHITISDFGYSGDLTVAPGEKVIVTNKDSVAHTLTDKRTHLFDTGSIAANGGTGSFVAPTKTARYSFGCTFHPEMAGTLVVRKPAVAKHGTSLSTQKSQKVTKSQAIALLTKLTDKHTGHVLPRTKVTLLARADAKHAFHTVRTATTSATGRASVVAHPVKSTQYEWRYAGDGAHLASHSGVITLAVH